jgi:hypothetical protein
MDVNSKFTLKAKMRRNRVIQKKKGNHESGVNISTQIGFSKKKKKKSMLLAALNVLSGTRLDNHLLTVYLLWVSTECSGLQRSRYP